jgi:hypothetical protein
MTICRHGVFGLLILVYILVTRKLKRVPTSYQGRIVWGIVDLPRSNERWAAILGKISVLELIWELDRANDGGIYLTCESRLQLLCQID